MRIGVEEAVERDSLEVGARELLSDRREVVVEPGDGRHGVHLHAAHPFRRQHPLTGVGLDDLRHDQARKPRKRTPERRRAPRFDAVVELIDEGSLQLLDHANDVDPVTNARMRRHELGELVEEREVLGERRPNVRTLHLHHDLAPSAQASAMHLAKARRAQRLRVEEVEQLAQARTELRLDRLLDVLEGDRTHVILERLQLADVRRRKQIRTCGQHLSELDVRRPKLDEPLPKANRMRLHVGRFVRR